MLNKKPHGQAPIEIGVGSWMRLAIPRRRCKKRRHRFIMETCRLFRTECSRVHPEQMVKAVSEKELLIRIELGVGEAAAVVYTCNCTEAYVRINY